LPGDIESFGVRGEREMPFSVINRINWKELRAENPIILSITIINVQTVGG